jgi:probable phosphoglycerate mutase
MEMKWPSELLMIRHGQSEANVRKDASRDARAAGQVPESAWALTHERDQDTPLTGVGRERSYDLGVYLGKQYPTTRQLDCILTSPYVRTRETTEQIVRGLGYRPEIVVEERLREIEFGIFDGLTREGVQLKYPDEALRRDRDGKYWYRPPGGESRPDVRLRCHSVLGTICRDYVDKRLLLSCHSVIVLALRSLLERWGEQQYMQVDREDDVANCGLTRYMYNEGSGKLELREYNSVIKGWMKSTPT